MSISVIFSDGCTKKSAKFENIVDYTNSYQVIYNKVVSLVKPESRIQMGIVELFL